MISNDSYGNGKLVNEAYLSSNRLVCVCVRVCVCVIQVGRILRRDKEKCRVMVQLDRYEEQVFTMDYDSICHYVGGVDH